MDDSRSLLTHLQGIEDPRIDRSQRHKLIDILVIAVVGVLCGADGWDDIVFIAEEKESWLKKFLELPNGIPSADTLARVISRVSPTEFAAAFSAWMSDVTKLTSGEVIAIDGKTLRRSFDRASSKSAIHMVSAWATANGVVLGQVQVDDKSNEITAIPQLLDLLDVKGCIVTLDAMGCQKEIAEKIVKKKADYCLRLKGNQGNTQEVVKQYFDTTRLGESQQIETVDKDHGRLETRRYAVADAANVPELADGWPHCRSVARVQSTRELVGKVESETRYFLLSFAADVTKSARSIRSHWGIENALHWVLDVEFDEDRSRIRKDQAPANVAALRHLAINLLKQEKTLKASLGKKRLKCAMSNKYLGRVLQGAL
jgi:predicted transposase YbfD/YdcC